ncbi:uncharacterized protein LOC131190556 [Ahaetulla prasina]|uniref:uncharacterized protein LOC131190556 n=1 Tax=Ahaetulla prasina TaxID=499056 RepID=UPI0026491508|nr:uncharacterized protein LOC131190556 [Ahaetulla prasina]
MKVDLVPGTIILFILFLLIFWTFRFQQARGRLPPGPTPWLFLGNVLQKDVFPLYKTYPKLSKKYGPVFTLWIGTKPLVVICGYEAVKNALVTHSEEFGGRPPVPFLYQITKGNGIISEDKKWKVIRRFTVTTLRNFGMGRKSMAERILEEAHYLVKRITTFEGQPFDILSPITSAVSNVTCSVVFGNRLSYEAKITELLDILQTFSGLFTSPSGTVYNALPNIMNFLPGPHKKVFSDCNKVCDFIRNEVDTHKKTLDPDNPRDYIDCFLLKLEKEEMASERNFCQSNLVITVFALFAAGTVTTSYALLRSLLLIAKLPHIQAKVQQEIDEAVGTNRTPSMEDRLKMPFTNAVIHEVQRYQTVSLENLPRATTCDVKFHGYNFPKYMAVVPVLSSVHCDPLHWETPEKFNPDHFLDEKGQFRKRDAFMPFSAGKRACPGEALARMELFLLFSTLLQKFIFYLDGDTKDTDVKSLFMDFKDKNQYPLIRAVKRSVDTSVQIGSLLPTPKFYLFYSIKARRINVQVKLGLHVSPMPEASNTIKCIAVLMKEIKECTIVAKSVIICAKVFLNITKACEKRYRKRACQGEALELFLFKNFMLYLGGDTEDTDSKITQKRMELTWAGALLLLSIILTLFSSFQMYKKKGQLPPGPTPWPILGNLFQQDVLPLDKSSKKLIAKYGPIFTVWIGSKPMVALCGYEVVKDALINQAEEFGLDTTDEKKWKELRRFTLSTLRHFGMGKKRMSERVQEEALCLVEEIAAKKGSLKKLKVVLINKIRSAVSNVICAVVFGNRFDYKDHTFIENQQIMKSQIRFLTSFLGLIYNTFPKIMEYFPGKHVKIFAEIKKLCDYIREEVELHKKTLDPQNPRDYIDCFLHRLEKDQNSSEGIYSPEELVFTVFGLFTAGTVTTSNTLLCSLLAMAKLQHIQAKVQQEIDEAVGTNQTPSMEDRLKMPFTNAVVHEAQRYRTGTAESFPRATTCDVKFHGYDIPKYMAVVPVLSTVHSDPLHWETPENFNPDHFLDEKGQFRKRNAFMPFSAGKRACPGEALARMELFLLFSTLLQKFTFYLDGDTKDTDVKSLFMDFKNKNQYPLIRAVKR